MVSIALGKQLAWIVAQKNNLSFKQSRDFVKNFYSGSRAIADQTVKAELDNVSSVTDIIYQHDIVKTFEQSFAGWLTAQSSNFLYGLENFEADISQGATQGFDSFYLRHQQKRIAFFQGEYFYHPLTAQYLKIPSVCIHSCKELLPGDILAISVPFCDTGNSVEDLESILTHCDQHNIPVLLDCAYWTISSGLQLNLNHSCIDTIMFSLSKTFPVAHARIGMRYTRPGLRDGQKLHSQINYSNRLSAAIGQQLISKFSSDYIVTKYKTQQLKLCSLLGLVPSQSVIFADGTAEWQEYGRKGLLETYNYDTDYRLFKNRICLTQLLENNNILQQVLETL